MGIGFERGGYLAGKVSLPSHLIGKGYVQTKFEHAEANSEPRSDARLLLDVPQTTD